MAFPTNPSDGDRYKDYVYSSSRGGWKYSLQLDGSTELRAAPSGYYLANEFSLSSGWYWIKSPSMPNALEMYVDMTEEGGGFDFYPIQGNGISVNRYDSTNSGTALGLDLVYPRSQAHWKAQYNFVVNVLGESVSDYFKAPAVYRNKTSSNVPIISGDNGDYTDYAMNSDTAPDWRVKDGGRWWLMDSPFTEPNGDYTYGTFLGVAGYSTYTVNNDGSLSGFNDVTDGYSTGTYYLLSTNAKP